MMTTNPVADAERYEDRMAELDALVEAEKAQAYNILLKVMMKCTADEWGSEKQIGGMYVSPDELLYDALHFYEDVAAIKAYNSYMVGTGGREVLIKAVAACIADEEYEDILKGECDE